MIRILIFIFLLPLVLFAQPTYNITVNTPDAFQGNLFFQRGGTPQKPVKIIDPAGVEIFSQNLGMKGWDFKVNDNNKISYFDRSSNGWFVMDSLQNVIDTVYCKNGYVADNHDFIALDNGSYVLIAYDNQPYAMDTVVPGGDPNAMIEGLIIQELDSNHNLIFEWKSWNHFHITDNAYLSPWTGSQLSFIHANAIDIDFDGHFLISSRNLDEITKIHRITGEIIWRWGGVRNEFTFINDYPFTHQHTIRSLGGNRYLLYDNGNFSSQYIGSSLSRAVEYKLDTILMTAEKTWDFVHPDSLYTPSIGGIQRLPNGNTLINFGNLQLLNLGSIVTEVDSNNNIVFQIEFSNGSNLYRAHKFDWFFYTPCVNPIANFVADTVYQGSPTNFNNLSSPGGVNFSFFLWSMIGDGFFAPGYDSSMQNTKFIFDTCGVYPVQLIVVDVSGCSDTIINFVEVLCDNFNFINEEKKNNDIVRIIDILGRKSGLIRNKVLFEIYSDGTFRKKIIIE